MRLFSQRVRTDSSPARHGESTFSFLDRVEGPVWDQCRELISAWVASYPKADSAGMIARLSSGDDRVFTSAFWELYLHETYRRGGWDIEIEPTVPHAETRPDFRVSKAHETYYIEARCTFGGGDPGAAARLRDVYASLDTIDSGAFLLAVTTIQIGHTPPSTRALRKDLEKWLATLDPDVDGFGLHPAASAHELVWMKDDWHLVFHPISRKVSARGVRARRPLGVFVPGAADFIDDIGTLRAALEDKGSKYGELHHPLVLAINIGSGFHDERDTVQALYGTVGWRFDFNKPDAEPAPVLTEAGYWGWPQRPAHTHVAGVLLAEGMHYGRVARYAPAYWAHPHAIAAIDPLPIWRVAVPAVEDTTYTDPRTLPHVHFGVPHDWPRGDPFPQNSKRENP